MPLESINPATGELIRSYQPMAPAQVKDILREGARAQRDWRRTSFAERGAKLKAAAALLRKKAEDHARLMTREMGKPITQGRAEVEKCAWALEFYADNGESFLRPEPAPSDASRSYVTFQPLGLVLAIMPWNFPYWQVIRFAAPALMAGNTRVLKHAANVSGCALAVEELFPQAAFPAGGLRTPATRSERRSR